MDKTTTKINEKLRTSNNVLKTLNTRLYVWPSFTDDLHFSIHDIPDETQTLLDTYIATVSIEKGEKSKVTYNGKEYKVGDIDTLIEDFRAYNKTLPFPANTYNPALRLSARVEMQIGWHLRTIGFKYVNEWKGDKGYFLYDSNMKTIMGLDFVVEDEGNGTIFMFTDSTYNFISCKFKTAEEAMSIINSFVVANLAMIADKCIETIGMCGTRLSPLSDATEHDMKNTISAILGTNTKRYIDTIYPMLKKLVNKIEENHPELIGTENEDNKQE